MLDNFDLFQDMDANHKASERILGNLDVARYIVNHLDVFQSIGSVVTLKKNATSLFDKLIKTERVLRKFQKTTIPSLFAGS